VDTTTVTSNSDDGLDDLLDGVALADPTDPDGHNQDRDTPDAVTDYSIIGREGGSASGEIDPTPIINIIRDPGKYAADGVWRNLKNGCPMSMGRPHPKGKGIAFRVDDGRLTLLCRCDEHEHPGAKQSIDLSGRTYWTYSVRCESNPSVRRNRFPPFRTGSHTDIARVLLSTVLAGAQYDSPTSIRTYDADVGDSGGLHRRGAKRPSPMAGKWIRWTEDNVKRIVQTLDGEYIQQGKDKNGKDKYRMLRMDAGAVNGIFEQVMVFVRHNRSRDSDGAAADGSPVSKFQHPHAPCIPVRGAILDLATNTFVGPDSTSSRDYFVCAEQTLQVDPWIGNPMAPRWGSYLHSVWGHCNDFIERVSFLQEWVGVALAGETVLGQVHLMLKGDAGTGKSQIIDVVSSLFPSSSLISVSPTQLGRFDCAGFSQARLNAVAEPDAAGIADAAKMKALQSGDLIQVERKNKDPWYIRSRAAWIVACNSSWKPSENDDSVYRRWTVLSFDRRVPIDRRVADIGRSIVADEMQGIIAWAVQGYQRYVANGRRYTQVPSSDAAIAGWRIDVEPLRQWVAECTMPVQSTQEATLAKVLLAHYLDWARSCGFKTLYNATSFGRELRKIGLTQALHRNGSTWGIALSSAMVADPAIAKLDI